MKNIKYGLYNYNTENIGDEIQSIAARRFLPRIDYYFDRDNIDGTKIDENDEIKLIMNGWYTHKPENWPPKMPNIKPLLISMFVEQNKNADSYSADVFSSEESINFLNKFAPVGARDESTADFFKKIGVNSYFSGCVTLTLNADKRVKKQNFILAVDVSNKIYDKLKRMTNRDIVRLDTFRLSDLTHDEKFRLAEYWLMLYQSAHMVITPRLHCMLPCLAFETPVLAISGRDPRRYTGLIELTNNLTEQEVLDNNFSCDFEHPKKNPDIYKKLRKSLSERCKEYTGFDSENSYISHTSPEQLINSPSLLNAIGKSVASGFELDGLKKKFSSLETQFCELQKQNSLLNSRIEALIEESKNMGVKISAKHLFSASKAFIKKKIKS